MFNNIIILLSGINKNKLEPFMAGKMLEGRLAIAENLGAQALRSVKRKNEFNAIIQQIRRANTGRISLIHGVWETTNFLQALVNGPNGKAKAVNKKNPAAKAVGADKAEKIAKELSEAHNALHRFYLNVWLFPRARSLSRSRAK